MSSLGTTELLKSSSQQNTRKMVRARTQCVGVGARGGWWWVGGGGGVGGVGRGGKGIEEGIIVISLACMWFPSVLPSIHIHTCMYNNYIK